MWGEPYQVICYLCIMSIVKHAGNPGPAGITSPESMYAAIKRLGIVPFFENTVRGYSIEELTPREFWFDDDDIFWGHSVRVDMHPDGTPDSAEIS